MPLPPRPECIQVIQDAVSLYFTQYSLLNFLRRNKDREEQANFGRVVLTLWRRNLGINQEVFLLLCNKFCDIETRTHLEKASLFAKVHLANI
jgi:hypothetical protein